MLVQRTISPVDGSTFCERELATAAHLDAVLARGTRAFSGWRTVPLDQRIALLTKAVDLLLEHTDELANELTWQMGRPIRYTPGEIRGFEERARSLLAQAPEALADIVPPPKDGFRRFVRRDPVGLVLVLAAWNYPWLIAVNAIWPALLAGNTVVLKHSDQTPLVAERLAWALEEAGVPDGVFQFVHMTHDLCAQAIRDSRVAQVAFTGSVAGGRAVHSAAAGTFKPVGLELGGKDPAWVRADAPLQATVDSLVDGAMFNSGQSCCAVERVYVHTDLYDDFVEAFVAAVDAYVLDDPTKPETMIGPVVRPAAADAIKRQVMSAMAAGARPLIDERKFTIAQPGTAYVAPQVLVDVNHRMDVMTEETFGPVVGIMRARDDDEAVHLMNDSRYGLTASIWTQDVDAALTLGDRLETGTVFMNRCDYLDPELAWVGVKDSGRGATLSRVGFEQLTRARSFHLRETL